MSHMKLSKSEIKELGNRRILTIEVPAEEVLHHREHIVADIQKQAKLQGFRPGKAPREVVEKEFQKEILQETLQHVIQEAYQTALHEHKIHPLSRGEISDVKSDAGQPISFKAIVEVRPKIELPTYKGLSVEKPKAEVTDGDVEMVLETLRHQRAEYVPIAERGAKEGDVVTVDLKGMKDLKMLPNVSESNASFMLGSKSFEPLEQALVGVKAGEERRVVVKIPNDHPDDTIKGQDVTFYATVKEMKEPKLPPLDETFIKTVSTADNVETLKKQIHDQLMYERERASRDIVKKEIIRQLVEKASFEAPESMVQSEYDRMLQDLDHQLQQKGSSLEKIPTPEQLEVKKSYWKAAQDRVKGSLILEEIAAKEKFSPTAEALDQVVQNILQAPQVDDRLKRHVQTDSGKMQLSYDLTIEQTIDFLIQQAKITMIEMKKS